ncbi:MAG: ABC transporter substrate-binding protein [Synergistetes bacterium]|nr:ABC transporter substrate-binding protein [Synergistota bacterium]
MKRFLVVFLFFVLFFDAVAYAGQYNRIISLYAAHTENLFSLGLNKQIIGVSTSEAFPPQALRKPVFSYREDPEKIISAGPDLVLIRPFIQRRHPSFVKKLKDAGINLVSLQPNTFSQMFSYWLELGRLTGRVEQAKAMIKRFKTGAKKIRGIVSKIPKSERKRVFFESIHRGPKTVAPMSIAHTALEIAGGIDVATDAVVAKKGSNIAYYSKEKLLSHADEIDVYIAQRGAMNHVKLRKIYEESGYGAIKAVREHQVYIIDEKIVSRPTMRLLYGIEELGRIMYPRYFNDVSKYDNDKPINRIQFAEIVVKLTNMRYKTPGYRRYWRRDYITTPGGRHFYGYFKDVNYDSHEYLYAETAAYHSFIPLDSPYYFYPKKPVTRKELAYAIFVLFDLPEGKQFPIKDVVEGSPFYSHVEAVVSNGIMKLKNARFYPNRVVSGREVIRCVRKAMGIVGR